MVVIPADHLSEETLCALIEEFVTRHGAIQGEDVPVERKIEQVRRLLKSGEASIVWDPETESAGLMTRQELESLGKRGEWPDNE